MTDEEIDFLARHIHPTDRVFEWGAGLSTLWLAARCRHVTTVEHDPRYAVGVIGLSPRNVSVVWAPPDMPYEPDEHGVLGDGDDETFRTYVRAYTGADVDVVLIDGRARVACARQVADAAFVGPHPDMRVFVHDAERPEYAPIWTDGHDAQGRPWKAHFDLQLRVGRLALLRPRL